MPFQKEEKASPLPHISQKEVEGSRGKQNMNLSSAFPRGSQAVSGALWSHKPFDVHESEVKCWFQTKRMLWSAAFSVSSCNWKNPRL